MSTTAEVPVMVALRLTISKPKFRCILVDRFKQFSSLFQELLKDEEFEDKEGLSDKNPVVQVSTTETGQGIPFHLRITINQAFKMLHSDVLWVTFELPSQNCASAPPTGVKNAFDVLRNAQRQSSKSSLPSKYPNPINGTFKVFNHLVDLCQETVVFFRYFKFFIYFQNLIFFILIQARRM